MARGSDGGCATGRLSLERFATATARLTPKSPRAGRALALLSVAGFLAAAVYAVVELPPIEGGVDWWLIVLAGVTGGPAMVALLAAEYRASAFVVGHDVGWAVSLRVAVLATVANLLPLPGSVVVRTEALRRAGVGSARAIGSTVVIGVAWVSTTVLVVGLLHLTTVPLGPLLIASGVAGLVMGAVLLTRIATSRALSAGARIVAIECGFVVVATLRLWLVLTALGIDADASDAAALTVAGVLSSVTGFVPAGLGVRELLTGALSPLVGIPAAVGVLAATLIRITQFIVLAPIGAATLRSSRVAGVQSDREPATERR